MNDLLSETDFRLFAVSVRFPQGMSGRVPLRQVQEGVYEADHFTGVIRLVVVHQLRLEEQNAMMHLFAAGVKMVRYGGTHYRPRSLETSTFLNKLFARYRVEGTPMPYTKEEFIREAKDELARDPEVIDRVLKGSSPEKRLEGLSAEEILRGISPEMLAEIQRRSQGGK